MRAGGDVAVESYAVAGLEENHGFGGLAFRDVEYRAVQSDCDVAVDYKLAGSAYIDFGVPPSVLDQQVSGLDVASV